MTGTGTQADPYIIQNFDDLLNVSGGSGTYYKLGVDIDVNDTPYANGWKSQVNLECSSFDGDGHTIRNIVMSQPITYGDYKFTFPFGCSSSFSGSTAYKNLNIENAYILGENPGLFRFYVRTHTFTNCRFSVHFFSSHSDSVASFGLIAAYSNVIADLYDCSFFLEIDEDKYFHTLWDSGSIYDCQFKVNIRTNASNGLKLFYKDFNGSSLLGSITCSNTSYSPTFFNSMSNSYMAANVSGFGTITLAESVPLTSFYDKELIDSASSIATATSLYPLTTAQCKDAVYLKSIGFAVEGSD